MRISGVSIRTVAAEGDVGVLWVTDAIARTIRDHHLRSFVRTNDAMFLPQTRLRAHSKRTVVLGADVLGLEGTVQLVGRVSTIVNSCNNKQYPVIL